MNDLDIIKKQLEYENLSSDEKEKIDIEQELDLFEQEHDILFMNSVFN